MNTEEQLIKSTIRISVDEINAVGTCFYFQYQNICGKDIDVLVTNKHIQEAGTDFTFYFGTTAERKAQAVAFHTNPDEWLVHDSADLAIYPLHYIYDALKDDDIVLSVHPITQSCLPTDDDINQISCFEDILTIGYPDGKFDVYNNIPISLHGITATPYSVDVLNKPEFMIDASIQHGSSGSPVFAKYRSDKPLLLGIFCRVYTIEFTSDIHFSGLTIEKAKFKIPSGTGYVIKSRCLLDFIPKLEAYVKNQ